MNDTIDILKPAGHTLLRHGGCMFLPRPWVEIAEAAVLRDQPVLSRAGQPNRCQYVYRMDTANLFVRGFVSHPDDGTIRLPYWHRVVSLD